MGDAVSPALAELLRKEIESLERLAVDLRGILDGSCPSEAELATAPIIDHYERVPHTVTCLAGEIRGHPETGDIVGRTSELLYIAPSRGWARTRSRFYRLARPLDAPKHHGSNQGFEIANVLGMSLINGGGGTVVARSDRSDMTEPLISKGRSEPEEST